MLKHSVYSYVIPQVEIPSTDQAAGVDEGHDVEADTQDAEHRQYCVELYTGGGIGTLIFDLLGPYKCGFKNVSNPTKCYLN